MSDIANNVKRLNDMILQGKALDAFDALYDEQVVMQENDNPPVVGKAANRAREVEFFGNIVEWKKGEVKAVAIGDQVSMVEWYMEYTHKLWGKKAYHQIAVQTWKNGKIVKEKFYYGS